MYVDLHRYKKPAEVLLETLEDLGSDEFKKFKWFIYQKGVFDDVPNIPKSQLETADRLDTVNQMTYTYNENSLVILKLVLQKICRNDLVKNLEDIITEPAGKVREASAGETLHSHIETFIS